MDDKKLKKNETICSTKNCGTIVNKKTAYKKKRGKNLPVSHYCSACEKEMKKKAREYRNKNLKKLKKERLKKGVENLTCNTRGCSAKGHKMVDATVYCREHYQALLEKKKKRQPKYKPQIEDWKEKRKSLTVDDQVCSVCGASATEKLGYTFYCSKHFKAEKDRRSRSYRERRLIDEIYIVKLGRVIAPQLTIGNLSSPLMIQGFLDFCEQYGLFVRNEHRVFDPNSENRNPYSFDNLLKPILALLEWKSSKWTCSHKRLQTQLEDYKRLALLDKKSNYTVIAFSIDGSLGAGDLEAGLIWLRDRVRTFHKINRLNKNFNPNFFPAINRKIAQARKIKMEMAHLTGDEIKSEYLMEVV